MGLQHPLAAIRRRGAQRGDAPAGFRFVAMGDSFTAGPGCEPEDRWADRLAGWLREVYSPLGYENLAIDGASSEDVLDQLDPALELRPDLVTIICGANDVLKSVRPDIEGYAIRLTTIFTRFRETSPRGAIVTATSPEYWKFADLRPRTLDRLSRGIRRINEATRRIASSHGVECIDVAGHPLLEQRENFAPDGFHPSVTGHARAAVVIAGMLRTRFGIQSKPPEEER
jgi:lysophospholipase L1-like esterase